MYKEPVYINVQGVCIFLCEIYIQGICIYIYIHMESVYIYVQGVCIYLCTGSLYISIYNESIYIYTMSLYIIMYRESVREIVESEEFAQVVSDSTRQHFKVHRHTNLTVVSLVIYQRECLQKMKGGYRLTAKKRAFSRF